MTMTSEAPTTEGTTSDPTRTELTALIDGKALVTFAKNAVTFTSPTRENRPVLQHVLTSVKDGRLDTVSTDSYGLLHQSIGFDGGDNGSSAATLLVDWAPVAAMKLSGGLVKVTVSADAVVVDAGTQVISLPHYTLGGFPRWESLCPKPLADRRGGDDVFSFALGQGPCVKKLAKLAAPGERTGALIYRFTPGETALKPFTVECGHGEWTAYMIFMPVRPS